jgi:hypothetical protein
MNGVVSIIESHRLTILSNTSIQELKLSEYSKHKLQLLHKAKEYDPVLIKEFDSVRLELQSILHLSVLDFQNSKMFSDSLQFRGRRISLSQKMVTKEKLLLAVGNPFMAKIITKMMQDLYYDVTCVSTGMSAMSELMNSVYHVTLIGFDLKDKSPTRVMQDFLRGEDRCMKKIPKYKRPVRLLQYILRVSNPYYLTNLLFILDIYMYNEQTHHNSEGSRVECRI